MVLHILLKMFIFTSGTFKALQLKQCEPFPLDVSKIIFGHLGCDQTVSAEGNILRDERSNGLMRLLTSIIHRFFLPLSHVKGYIRMPEQFSVEGGDVMRHSIGIRGVSLHIGGRNDVLVGLETQL